MKKLMLCFSLMLCIASVSAQILATVSVFKSKPFRGMVKVFNDEGLGLEDENGKYHIIRSSQIKQVTFERKLLTIQDFAHRFYFSFNPGVEFIAYTKDQRLVYSWATLQKMATEPDQESLSLSQKLGISVQHKTLKQQFKVNGEAAYWRDQYATIADFLYTPFAYEKGRTDDETVVY